MSFDFGRPRSAAAMRLKCCCTQVWFWIARVFIAQHTNVAVLSGIRDSGSVGPDRIRIRPNTAAAFLAPGVFAESAPEASPA